MGKAKADGPRTPVSVEDIFDTHVTALGLPDRNATETLDDYPARIAKIAVTPGRRAEVARCLTAAADAATIADHANTAHWLAQARQHLPTD
jgi:hypothetical protein